MIESGTYTTKRGRTLFYTYDTQSHKITASEDKKIGQNPNPIRVDVPCTKELKLHIIYKYNVKPASDRFEVMIGFNTKQFWVYDNKNNAYIDPPADVLKDLSIHDPNDEQKLTDIVNTNPSWLYDYGYSYDDDDFEP